MARTRISRFGDDGEHLTQNDVIPLTLLHGKKTAKHVKSSPKSPAPPRSHEQSPVISTPRPCAKPKPPPRPSPRRHLPIQDHASRLRAIRRRAGDYHTRNPRRFRGRGTGTNRSHAGTLPPDIATALVTACGTLARIEEIEDLRDRLSALEKATSPPTSKP